MPSLFLLERYAMNIQITWMLDFFDLIKKLFGFIGSNQQPDCFVFECFKQHITEGERRE